MGLFDGLFDKEQMVKDTITNCLENLKEELNCKHDELFIMIKPTNLELDFKCWVYKVDGSPKLLREISLKEILGDKDE